MERKPFRCIIQVTNTTSGFSLRPATLADVAAMVALETDRFNTDRISARSFRRWLHLGTAGFMVAEKGGQLAGYVLVTHRTNSSVFRLYAIAVNAQFARQGLGRQLLAWAEDYALSNKATEMRLEVQSSNAAALHMYTRAGYTPLCSLPAYYEDGSDGQRLIKALVD